MKRIPAAPAYAVRGVYRCIVRHCNHINESGLLKTIRAQFARRKNAAKIGHIRAAFSLEESLRNVCLGKEKLSEVVGKFTKTKLSKRMPERNSESRYMLWIQHESRRFDEFNSPPSGEDKRRVDRQAKLNNRRWNYIHRYLAGIPPSKLDMKVIDTVLAPAQYKDKPTVKHTQPRPVEIKTIIRGGQLSILTVKGVPSRLRGFRQHIKRSEIDTSSHAAALDKSLKIARDYVKEDPDFSDWVKELQNARNQLTLGQQQRSLAMEVHRRILIRRQKELQREWKWRFDRANSLSQPKVAPPLRLHDL